VVPKHQRNSASLPSTDHEAERDRPRSRPAISLNQPEVTLRRRWLRRIRAPCQRSIM
jgi:hypothetical protein